MGSRGGSYNIFEVNEYGDTISTQYFRNIQKAIKYAKELLKEGKKLVYSIAMQGALKDLGIYLEGIQK